MAKRPKSLFTMASSAAKFAARRAFRKTSFGKAVTSSQQALKRGLTGKLKLEIQKQVRNMSGRPVVREFNREVQRYSISGVAMQAVDALLGSLGPLGTVIRAQLHRSHRKPSDQLQMAADLLRHHGYEILGKDKNWQGYQRGEEAAKQLLEEAGYTVTPNGRVVPDRQSPVWARPPKWPGSERTVGKPGTDQSQWEQEPAQQPDNREPEPRVPDRQDEEEYTPARFSPLVRTPQSSNVYSFQYDYERKTLYVRYQAHVVSNVTASKAGGLRHVKGTLGKTVGGKTGGPGPLYAYYGVPERIFDRLASASSPGGAVWDNLRVRGTAYGHQFSYGLTEGQQIEHEGEKAFYVPRRATRTGFRSRTLAQFGTGRRSYAHSALPEQRFGPNRGRPSRGSPNRGR